MSFQDHLKTCSYCRKDSQKETVSIKSASSYYREKKLAELCAVIKGVSYPGISYVGSFRKTENSGSIKKTNPIKSKGASIAEKSQKLKELGKMIRGPVR
jgi:hypothetical protein